MNKVYPEAKSTLDGILKVIMSGGFGLCGIAQELPEAIRESRVKGLTVVSNNAGIDDIALSRLPETRQVKKMISSYVGENNRPAIPRRRAGTRIQPAGHAGRAHSRGLCRHSGLTKTGEARSRVFASSW